MHIRISWHCRDFVGAVPMNMGKIVGAFISIYRHDNFIHSSDSEITQ